MLRLSRGVRRLNVLSLGRNREYSQSQVALARILATDSIQSICGEVFRSRGHELVEMPGIDKEELLKVLPEYDGMVVRSRTKVTKEVIDAGKGLKMIGRAGTGVDNIDTAYATSKGILVVNTPGGNTVSTAELAVTHILALARNIPQAVASLKEGRWDRSLYTGSELSGKTLGVIGLGRIGREVASRCQGFGMSTIGYDPVLSESTARSADISLVSLDELFEKSDFITVHTPLTKETKYLIDAETLAKCKDGVRIINCARGGIVHEKDLLDAIQSGQVSGASLDTFEIEPPVEASRELRMHPNVIVSPHLGASTLDAQTRVARMVAENMSDILAGGDYKGVVNAPDLSAINKVPGVKPYVLLAERIGSMQGQLLGTSKVNQVHISLNGKVVASDSRITEVVKSAVLKGLLGVLKDSHVSYVSATGMAEESGLAVATSLSESISNTKSGYSNTVTVELEYDGLLNMTRTIQGTVVGDSEMRITQIDGYDINFPTGNSILVFNNNDEPGVMRRIAEKISALGINIANFSLGRKELKKKAMGALVLDYPVGQANLDEIAKHAQVSNLFQLEFESALDPIFRVSSGDISQGVVSGVRKPSNKPHNPEFSSGPCKKRPGYDLSGLRTDVLGRSHRSKLGKNRLLKAIEDTKRILKLPDDYYCGIVPASDTGAFEMAMWNYLGNNRPVDTCFWESFGQGWRDDATKHLKLENVREISADYGHLPDLSQTNPDHDILFTYNGTTSGVRVPNLDWISDNREGLTFNDCTSAAFAMDIDWQKTDISTFSWQKVLGGEGAHGMLILSPRAVERLEKEPPARPLPKIFRMLKKGKFDANIFKGDTINTPSMLCVEDYIDAMTWADGIGGLDGLISKSMDNLNVIKKFVAQHDWIDFLAEEESTISNTSVCLKLKLDKDQTKRFISLLESEAVAYDIGSYRAAPDGLRIWCGATVDAEDLELLMPWLSWAYEIVQNP